MHSMKKEIWKDIPGLPFYQASSFGRIRSLQREKSYFCSAGLNKGKTITRKYKGRILRQKDKHNGYKSIFLEGVSGATTKESYVHRFVCMAFLGLKNNKKLPRKEVNHINGVKSDNRLENLEVVTPYKNRMHAIRTGLLKKSNVGKNILTPESVRAIRYFHVPKNGEIKRILAKIFDVSESTISYIHLRKTHKDVTV